MGKTVATSKSVADCQAIDAGFESAEVQGVAREWDNAAMAARAGADLRRKFGGKVGVHKFLAQVCNPQSMLHSDLVASIR